MNQICMQVSIIVTLSCHIAFGLEDQLPRPRMTACTYDADCIPNAYCKDQEYCLCKSDYIVHKRPDGTYACLKEATQLNDPCEVAIQCTKPFGVDAICYQGAGCQCRVGAHFKQGRCYETSILGGKCKVRNNCKIDSDIDVFCDRSICVCPQRYHPNSLGTDCLVSKYIGETCESNDHCLINNSYCADVCRCKIGFIASQDDQRCLKAAEKEGDHCEEPAQCNVFLENMRCLKGLCICRENYHPMPPDNICWRSISIGDKCEDSRQCVVTSQNPNAVACLQGVCKCAAGYLGNVADVKDCIIGSGSGQASVLPHVASVTSLILLLLIVKYT